MLSQTPHLTTFRPSPTTVSFTVSTASSSRLQHYSLLLLRLLAGLSTLLVLFTRSLVPIPDVLLPLARRVELIPWTVVGPVALGSLFLVFRRFHTEESLLTLRTLGIQNRTLSPSYLLPATTRFIPTAQIRDLFIHEAFRGMEVRYYLAVVVEGEGDVVVVFPKLLPNLAIVEKVWRGARECLYEPTAKLPTT